MMLTPQRMIADLDAALGRNSEPIKLRRKSDATAAILELRGNVVNDGDPQLAGNLAQQVMRVIMSPTELRQWTVATPPGTNDAQLPAKNLGDEVYLRGRWRAIESVSAFYPTGVLVRVALRVVG